MCIRYREKFVCERCKDERTENELVPCKAKPERAPYCAEIRTEESVVSISKCKACKADRKAGKAALKANPTAFSDQFDEVEESQILQDIASHQKWLSERDRAKGQSWATSGYTEEDLDPLSGAFREQIQEVAAAKRKDLVARVGKALDEDRSLGKK